jgi:hypothetical protein
MLLVDLGHIALVTGQANRHLVTKAKGRVVPSLERNRTNIETSPPRELLGHKARDDLDGDLLLAHASLIAVREDGGQALFCPAEDPDTGF